MKERLLHFREHSHVLLARWVGNDMTILIFGAMVGAAGGAVAALFGSLVEYTARLAWGVNDVYGGRGWLSMLLLVMVPAIGGLLVGLIQNHLAKTGPTHGIPEIVAAVVKKQGVIPVRTGGWKALTAALTLGTGGCAGMEGPVVTIGAVAGSGVGRLIGVKRADLPVLVGCGMAAAIAAAFTAPIAGVLFVLEVILCDFSLRLFMPIVVASVVGTVASQGLRDTFFSHGENHGALFMADSTLAGHHSTLIETPVYVLLGLLCGVLGFAMTWLLHHSETWWKRAPGPAWMRPGLGGLALGVLGLCFGLMMPHGDGVFRSLSGYGLPAFMGNGYSVIESLFKPGHFEGPISFGIGALLIVALFKVLGVGLTLGSGGSGGAIAPSLFIGAAAGGCVGCIAQWTGWFPNMTPATYALVGMAGVIASSFRCPLTAFVLVFELTHDYAMILPAMVVAILAVTIARRMGRESLVAMQLREKGIRSGTGVAILRRAHVSEIPLAEAHFLNEQDDAVRLLLLASKTHADDFVVQSADGKYRGMIYSDRVREVLLDREALPLLIVADLMDAQAPTVLKSETLESVMEKFSETKAHCLPVQDDRGRVLGLVTHERLMSYYHQIAAQD